MGQNTDVMMQDMQSYSSPQPQEIAEAIVSFQAPYQIQQVNEAWINVTGFRSVTGSTPHIIHARALISTEMQTHQHTLCAARHTDTAQHHVCVLNVCCSPVVLVVPHFCLLHLTFVLLSCISLCELLITHAVFFLQCCASYRAITLSYSGPNHKSDGHQFFVQVGKPREQVVFGDHSAVHTQRPVRRRAYDRDADSQRPQET